MIDFTANPTDGDTVRLGTGSFETFEFDNDASATGTPVSIGATPTDTATNFQTVVNASALPISATRVGAVVTLVPTGAAITLSIKKNEAGSVLDIDTISGGPDFVDELTEWRWAEGEWSQTNGYPRAIALHEQRLWLGYTNTKPTTLWFSHIDDYGDFSPGLSNDDEGGARTIGGNGQINPILTLSSNRELMVGTTGGWYSTRRNADEAITPTNIRIRSENATPSARIAPLSVETAMLFVRRDRSSVQELQYNDNINRNASIDLSFTVPHIAARGMNRLVWQSAPYDMIWTHDDAGIAYGLVYERETETLGWCERNFSGAVESMAVIPSADGTFDRLWLVVRRTINGSTVRHIEYMASEDEGIYMDSAVTYTGASAELIAVAHLEGETVGIVADGASRPDAVVSSGNAALPSGRGGESITAGLKYTATITTNYMEGGNQRGVAQGHKARSVKAKYRLVDTGPGFFYGVEDGTLDELPFLRVSLDAPPQYANGDTEWLGINSGYREGLAPTIEHREPFSCTVSAIFVSADVSEEI